MFMGLTKQVHSEKRRYRKKQEAAAAAAAARPETKKEEPIKPTSTPVSVVTVRPTPVRRISREAPNKNAVPIETPAAWARSNPPRKIEQSSRPVLPASVGRSRTSQKDNTIEKLKQKRQAVKQVEERLAQDQAEQRDAARRLAAQQRRLDRVRRHRSMT